MAMTDTRMENGPRTRHRKGVWALVVVAGVVAGSWMTAWGQVPPETGPGGPGGPSGPGTNVIPGEFRGPREGMGGRLGAFREEREARMSAPEGRVPGAPGERMSDEEQARFRVFVNSFMPNLDAARQEISSPRQRLWLMGMAKFQYQRYERGRRDFPQLEETFRQDIRNVDDMVRLAREYPSAPESRQGEIRVELRGKMKSVATNMMSERRKRIEKLRDQLEREERGLIRDEERLEGGLDSRVEELLRFGVRSTEGNGGSKQGGNDPSSKPPVPTTQPVGPG